MAANTHAGSGAVDQGDVNHWKDRFNDVLARPSEHFHSRSPADAQKWTNSFWSCCTPVETCFCACCLPCITFGKTHHRITRNGNMHGYEAINASCLLFCIAGCFGVPFVPAAMQRQSIRERYLLEGNCAKDLAAAYCCLCCTLVQSDKEAGQREALMRDQPPVTQQYQPNDSSMVYPAAPGVEQGVANVHNDHQAAATGPAGPSAPHAPPMAEVKQNPQV